MENLSNPISSTNNDFKLSLKKYSYANIRYNFANYFGLDVKKKKYNEILLEENFDKLKLLCYILFFHTTENFTIEILAKNLDITAELFINYCRICEHDKNLLNQYHNFVKFIYHENTES